jgi:hypothetical protein
MKTLPNRQLKCLIMESSGIIAVELEDELRFAFDAKIIPLSNHSEPENIDIAILDCPTSVPVFLSLIEQLRTKTRAFIFTHTDDLPFEVALTDIIYRNLPKPYPMRSVVSLVSDLIDQIDFGDAV